MPSRIRTGHVTCILFKLQKLTLLFTILVPVFSENSWRSLHSPPACTRSSWWPQSLCCETRTSAGSPVGWEGSQRQLDVQEGQTIKISKRWASSETWRTQAVPLKKPRSLTFCWGMWFTCFHLAIILFFSFFFLNLMNFSGILFWDNPGFLVQCRPPPRNILVHLLRSLCFADFCRSNFACFLFFFLTAHCSASWLAADRGQSSSSFLSYLQ